MSTQPIDIEEPEARQFCYSEKPAQFGFLITPATIDNRGAAILRLFSNVVRPDVYAAIEPEQYFLSKLNSLDIAAFQFQEVSDL